MATLDEKRIYDEGTTDAVLLGATAAGLVWAAVTGDQIGRFGMAERCDARAVAVTPQRVAVATATDVLVGPDRDTLSPADVGPARAVAFTSSGWIAGLDDGRLVAEREETGLQQLGEYSDIRAIDPPFVATADGVYRITQAASAGLTAVRDVAALPVPYAATDTALYRLGNGWLEERTGEATVVTGAADGRGLAVVEGTLMTRRTDAWHPASLDPETPVVDAALGPANYAVTGDGLLAVDAGNGWRTRSLGVPKVRALAARAETS
ncbi:MAG: hypothetical protein ABEJ35_03055 [Halobacteriaceae archaeon]